MTEATISVSVLNITVCVVIIIGCVYAMYQLIKKYQSVKQIKNPQGEIIGSKKTCSIVKTMILVFFLVIIILFAGYIGAMHIFNIILIFETFPIQTDTLVSCHFLTKLNLIINRVNEINSALACRIRTLVHYWDEQIKKIKLNKLLQKKRRRAKEESNAESENDSEDTQCSKPSKKVHWKDTLVDIVNINTNDIPCN